jgi:small subunit ribosomal protein S16
MPKQASYRVVVCDARKPRGGAVLENIGHYSPYKPDKPLDIKIERYHEWVQKGAQPTDAVKRLVKSFRKKGGDTAEVKGQADAGAAVQEKPPAETPPAESGPVDQETTAATENSE